MYNLTVDVAHTFFVGGGQWLVHNTCSTVIFEAELTEGVDYPLPGNTFNQRVQARYSHNRTANEQLFNAFESSPIFKTYLDTNFAGLTDFVQLNRNNNFPRTLPRRFGLEWHHDTWREGAIQLMTRADHKQFIDKLHLPPNWRGGFDIWGIIR